MTSFMFLLYKGEFGLESGCEDELKVDVLFMLIHLYTRFLNQIFQNQIY